ncbi:MAG TPA: CHAD domain-containing protein [Acidisoma sp.]|uniref:CYTH and CHAD domain-containing protein n=1 Tax=Acidisoma sp. TaxID=1872115 RepID=UPI002B8DE96A|nr:CHAD domain-containing protein [Acidisoma sp.]HTI02576.1 CHAD domain-containing protein [Acidisoma sp.]
MIILELTYPSTAEQDVLRHPALKPRGRRPRARKLERVWHDTVDFQLAHRDLALSEYAGQWHLDRLGLGWPRRPGTAAALIADAINPAGIEAELGEALPGPLRSVTRFTGEILRLPITLDGGPAECRILRGTLFALGLSGEASAPHPVYRMEIEATAAAAVDLAQQLAADLPVQPAVATLPHEALLLRGTRIKAPPAPPLDPGMATEDALAIIASGFVTTFLTRLGQIPGRSGPEPVHQARVTMRRLRALMLAFRPILKDSEDRVKDLLVELKAVLGPARDWDVFLSETVAPIAASLPEDQPAMLWLRDAAEAQRESAYAALIAYQHQADYRALLWQLAALCLGVGWRHFAPSVPEQQEQPDGPSVAAGAAPPPPLAADPKAEGDMSRLGEFALRCIDGRWKKTARPLRDVIPMPVTELHQLRIKCKKLRYQAEMFQDALPGKAARKLVRRLTNTQEIMGELNDGAVAGDLAESLRPKTRTTAREQVLAAEATGLVRGYGLGRASGSREAVIAAWRKLVKSNPF